MSFEDPIVAEVRQAREAHAAAFDYDIDRMFDAWEQKHQRHPERLAKLKPAEPRKPASPDTLK